MVAISSVVLWAITVGVAFALHRVHAHRQATLGRLIRKYNDYDIANCIFRREIWEGQTEAQLLDSLGTPIGVDYGLLGAKKREIWKYRPRGANHYRLRITLENGSVTEWHPKR
jgi:hypothetical protein